MQQTTQPKRRNTELSLLMMAMAIFSSAYALTSLGKTASLPAGIGPFLALVGILFLIAHIAVRRLAPGADGTLLPIAALLNGTGYVFIARINEQLASRQAAWTAIAILAFVVTLMLLPSPRDLIRYRYLALFGAIALIMSPLLPVLGHSQNGARIWLRLGPISFQPGEIAKLLLAIFFAAYLVEKRELLAIRSWPRRTPVLPDPKHLGPVLAAWSIAIIVIVAERDLGTALLFFALFVILIWISTGRPAYLVAGLAMFLGAALVANAQFAHVHTRFENWINPWQDPQDGGYQTLQAWYAMAGGGIAGRGLGQGSPNRVPAAENDFIFAIIGEELGLIGACAILAAFVLLVGSGLRIAVRQHGTFEKLLAAALTALVGVQAFIILAGVVRVLPLTGVVLPFVSFGGSALVANYILLALLIRLSDDANERELRLSAQPAGLQGTTS